MTACPKCGNEILPDQQECDECGIIVEKYLAMRNGAIKQVKALCQDKEFQKSLELLEEIRKRFPELSSEIEKNITDIKIEKYKIEFQKAVDSFDAKDFSSALSLFQSIQSEFPEHASDVQSYIDEISKKNLADQRKLAFDSAVRYFESRKYESARTAFLQLKDTEYQQESDEYLNKIERILGPTQEIERLGFIKSLFDLSFSAGALVTIHAMKYLYVFVSMIILFAFGVIIVGGVGEMIGGEFAKGNLIIIITVIGASVLILLSRVWVELVIVIFKINENLQVIAKNSKKQE